MDKDTLLDAVSTAAASGTITQEELTSAYSRGRGEIKHPPRKKITVVNVLYALGAAIVCIGIVLFFQQRWDELSTLARIAVTLGSGITAYVAGIFLSRVPKMKGVAWAFFLIFALITPIGIFIALDAYHYPVQDFGYENIIYAIMFFWTLVSLFLFKTNLFRFFTVVFGSLLYFSITGKLLQGYFGSYRTEFLEYRFLLLGISYVLFGYSWKDIAQGLVPWLYTFGTGMFLGAAIALGGYAPDANQLWEAAFAGIALGCMFLSITLKSRAILIVSSIFLMGYIMKLTSEYFSDTLGWPIALILAGFILIAIAYGTFRLGRTYLQK